VRGRRLGKRSRASSPARGGFLILAPLSILGEDSRKREVRFIGQGNFTRKYHFLSPTEFFSDQKAPRGSMNPLKGKEVTPAERMLFSVILRRSGGGRRTTGSACRRIGGKNRKKLPDRRKPRNAHCPGEQWQKSDQDSVSRPIKRWIRDLVRRTSKPDLGRKQVKATWRAGGEDSREAAPLQGDSIIMDAHFRT